MYESCWAGLKVCEEARQSLPMTQLLSVNIFQIESCRANLRTSGILALMLGKEP